AGALPYAAEPRGQNRQGQKHPGRASLSSGVALLAACLLVGCGGGSGSRATACPALDIPPVTNAAGATRTLRGAIAADEAALYVLDAGDPLAARFRGAKARAEQALASFTGDPLRSGSMSLT